MPLEVLATSYNRVKKDAKAFSATHLVSLLQPGHKPVFRPPSILPNNHLRLTLTDHVLDADSNLHDAPQRRHVESLFSFVERAPENARILFHCEAGISRSTAAAFLALVYRRGLIAAQECADEVLKGRPQARPNRLLLKIGANLLNDTNHTLMKVWNVQ